MIDRKIKKFKIRTCASTANLGSGFDSIGMALDIWNETTVEVGSFGYEIYGEGKEHLPYDVRNLVSTGIQKVFQLANETVPPLKFICHNNIPLGKGLGSSSAAIVTGLLAGFKLLGKEYTNDELVNIAADIEGHPDNVAPAIYGGITIGVHAEKKWVINKVDIHQNLACILYIPKFEISTHESRASLPLQVSRSDAIFNLSRSALLISAFMQGKLELLKYATDDRLHHPYRTGYIPSYNHIVKAAYEAGAYGVYISGSGPTIVILTGGREITISREVSYAAQQKKLNNIVKIVKPAQIGSHISNE